MICIFCGRLCDFLPSHTCRECAIKVFDVGERVYVLSLLREAYEAVADIRLREKIEYVLGITEKPPM